MHLTATPKSSEVEKAEPEFDSGVRLDPSNAQFILFYQTKVDNEIKKLHTEMSRLKEISKEISTRWKNLDEFSKQKYEKRVQENRNKYLKEIEEFRKRQEKNADQVENVNCEPTANGDSMPASTPDEVPAVVDDVAETEGNSISTEPMMVQLSDLGFAKQKNFSWY